MKTPYRCGSDIGVVARLCCRSQYDAKRIVVASIRLALWQRYTYHKTRYRYQSDTVLGKKAAEKIAGKKRPREKKAEEKIDDGINSRSKKRLKETIPKLFYNLHVIL